MNKRLETARKSLGLSQSKIASAIGISQASYSMFESGQRALLPRYIKAIEREFGINSEWLETGEGEMFIKSSHEDDFVTAFLALNEENQKLMMDLLKRLKESQKD